MAEGRYADWNVRMVAESFATKRPKHEWFENNPDDYSTSLRSWAHICAHQLHMMELEERQLIIFMYALGMDNIGVETFDPTNARAPSDFTPSEGRANI
jgi:hypothetical protein|tara:strand:+ start:701 stop:994 length:294 start_codon:yes stop_codon:yes gene_type:complete